MKKQAWIQDPKTANTARFHWDPKSWSADPMYFVDSGRPLTGLPPLLKTRSYLRREDARKLWMKLHPMAGVSAPPSGVTTLRSDLGPLSGPSQTPAQLNVWVVKYWPEEVSIQRAGDR